MDGYLERHKLEVSNDIVSDDELLYRCIFFESNCHQRQGSIVKISSQAFNDRNMTPSVDRAYLCNHNPAYTQKNEKDGVISLITHDVRMIDRVVQNDSKGNPIFTYKIDVYPRPIINHPELLDNLAHAQIEPTPHYKNKSIFRKLLERLAFLANQREWEIKPYDLRD